MKIANVLVSDAWGDVTPEALEKGIGGREGALLYLSREWAKFGHHVTSFVNVEKSKRFQEPRYDISPEEFVRGDNGHNKQFGFGYHEYIPLNTTKAVLQNFPHDVVIAWECPSIFNDELISENTGLRITEMQVAHLQDRETSALEENCDYLAVLSDWHGNLMLSSGLVFDPQKVVTLPNGVDISRYPRTDFDLKLKKKVGRNPKFVYSSSPDRGLWYLLEMWPYLREEYPGATLSVCYGTEKWIEYNKWSHGRVGDMAVKLKDLLKQDGVNDLGKIGQNQLSKLQIEADAWIYPLDSIQPTETGCITAIENAAAGNPIFTTDSDCMEEEFGQVGVITDLPFEAEKFARETIKVLNDPAYMEYLREVGRDFAEKRNWKNIAEQWVQLFNDHKMGVI